MLDSKISKTVYEITPGSIPLQAGYQISFTFFSNDQIRVYLTNGLTQTEVDSSKYSIVKSETIYKVAFLSDYVFPNDAIRLVIAREVAFQQNTNLINGELIDAEVLERALDLLAAMSQQLKEITERVVLSPISENTQTIIPEKSDRAGRILGFDEKGDPTSILTSDIDQKLKQSLSAQEQVIFLSSIIEGYRDQAYQSATNAQTSEENVLVKEEQVSGTLVQIQNIKQQIDNIENAVKLSEANTAESSSSAAKSANTASISESRSKESERNAASSASAALSSENNAKESEVNAKNSENASAQSASDSAASANLADRLVQEAKLNMVASIEQTKSSTESGGLNEVTITQKDGTQSKFSVYNGREGDKGDTGVGVRSMEQTQVSTESSGENVFTFTTTDGKTKEFKVKNGAKGDRGTDITSVEQIDASSVDEGMNTIKVTLSDGTSASFTVRNGSKGDVGVSGSVFGFYIDRSNGHLYCNYVDNEAPNFSIRNGHLIYEF